MSGMALEWAMRQEVSATQKLVLAALATFHSQKNEHIFPSLPTLAKVSCLDEKTVRRALPELEKAGLIEIERSSGRRSHRYKLLFEPGQRVQVPPVKPGTLPTFNEKQPGLSVPQPGLSVPTTWAESPPNKVFNKDKNKKVQADSRPPDCPHEAIIEAYHAALPTCPRVRVWHEGRRRLLAARWREDEKRQSIKFWEKFFSYVGNSDFLTGRTEGSAGRPPFVADLEWLIRPTNFAKVIEGRYHRDTETACRVTG